jgi:hypothetical protein
MLKSGIQERSLEWRYEVRNCQHRMVFIVMEVDEINHQLLYGKREIKD